MKGLTEREKMILQFAVFANCEDWKSLYTQSRDGKPTTIRGESLRQMASNWKCSDKVTLYIEEIRTIKAQRFKIALNDYILKHPEEIRQKLAEIAEKGTITNEQPETNARQPEKQNGRDSLIKYDFTNKDDLLRYLNQQANNTTDQKQRTDLLKLISDLLQFKQDDRTTEREQQQRFFTPLRCSNCQIYRNASAKMSLPEPEKLP